MRAKHFVAEKKSKRSPFHRKFRVHDLHIGMIFEAGGVEIFREKCGRVSAKAIVKEQRDHENDKKERQRLVIDAVVHVGDIKKDTHDAPEKDLTLVPEEKKKAFNKYHGQNIKQEVLAVGASFNETRFVSAYERNEPCIQGHDRDLVEQLVDGKKAARLVACDHVNRLTEFCCRKYFLPHERKTDNGGKKAAADDDPVMNEYRLSFGIHIHSVHPFF